MTSTSTAGTNVPSKPSGTSQFLGAMRESLALSGPSAMIIVLSLIMLIQAPSFFRWENLEAVVVDAALYMVLAVGMTFVISAKGIDLSIGSILVLSGVVMAASIKDFGMPPEIGMLLAILTGATLGAVNGILVTKLHLPDFVVTLGTDLVFRGLALVYASGAVFYGFDDIIVFFGRGEILGLKIPVMLGLLAVAIGHIAYRHSRFGRHTLAVGGNVQAARRVGLPVDRIRIYVYILSGLAAGIAAIVITGRLDAIQPTQGVLTNLHTIAAVIIGGTSLFGGRGSVIGAALGAVLLAMINNTMVLLGFSFFWQQVAAGAVILIAVSIYIASRGERDDAK